MAAGAAGDRVDGLTAHAQQGRIAGHRGVEAELVGLLASMALAVAARG
jgi:hypothetical protein